MLVSNSMEISLINQKKKKEHKADDRPQMIEKRKWFSLHHTLKYSRNLIECKANFVYRWKMPKKSKAKALL